MRKIYLHTTIAGPKGTAQAGSTITVEDAHAKSLVESGAAKYADLPPVIPSEEKASPPEPEAEPEKTDAKPEENASAGHKRKKKKSVKRPKRKS